MADDEQQKATQPDKPSHILLQIDLVAFSRGALLVVAVVILRMAFEWRPPGGVWTAGPDSLANSIMFFSSSLFLIILLHTSHIPLQFRIVLVIAVCFLTLRYTIGM